MPEYPRPRRHLRHRCERRITVVLGRSTIIDAWSNNVSQTGIGAFIPASLEAGDRLTVEVPDAFRNGSLLLSAEVRWRQQSTYGLELVHPTAFQQRVLSELGRI
jgi:hypothetical protein